VLAHRWFGEGDVVSAHRGEEADPVETPVIGQVDDVTDALTTLCALLDEQEDLAEALHRVCQQAVHAIGEAGFASVTLLGPDRPHVAATTGDHVHRIDHVQYQAGDGPCVEAAKSRKIVRVTVPEVVDRWPAFATSSAKAGIGSYLCAPLFVDDEHHGSLNLYHSDTHGFSGLEAALLRLYTASAEAALHASHRHRRARQHIDALQRALTSRAVIDQAKGIIMGAHRIPADQAFDMLVDRSQRQNVKLNQLAAQFVAEIIEAED
jgi:GAF domain-containing protein